MAGDRVNGRGRQLPGLSSAEILFAVDANQRVVAWNAQAVRALGYPANAAIGWHCYHLMAGRDQTGRRFCRHECPVMRAAAAGEAPATVSLEARRHDGTRVALEVSTIVLASGDVPGPVIHVCRDLARAVSPGREALPGELTTRELEVLRALCCGASTAAIARQMGISTTTVRNHMQRVLGKLAAHSRAEAVAVAYRHGLVLPP